MSEQSNGSFPEVLLVIEAATAAGSVALVRNGVTVAERDVVMGPSREDRLMPAIAETLNESGLSMRDVRAVACGSGPGSFTSLRIAAALAKGLAQASHIPLYAIPSMLLAALELRERTGLYLLHADALRGERFAQQFQVRDDSTVISVGAMQRLPLVEVERIAGAESASLVAVGAKTVSASDASAVVPHARNIALLRASWSSFRPVDIARWEPTYGRLAEAQVKWEETHQRDLPTS